MGHSRLGIGIFDDLYGYHLWCGNQGDWEDKMCWKPDQKKWLLGQYFLPTSGCPSKHQSSVFPLENHLEIKGPLRVAFFIWTAALGKILTIDNLGLRKLRITDWCFMCKCNGEYVDHLFLHCYIASNLWSTILGLFGVGWVMPKSAVELLDCWQS